MSDIRTKILLGTTIGAVTMMFVMASGFDFSSDAITAELQLPINGHGTLMAIHPDGSVSYAQGDNFIFGSGKDKAGNRLYDSTVGAPAAFTCIGMGDSGAVTEANQFINGPLTATNVACDTDGPDANFAGVDGAASAGNKVDVKVVMPAIGAGDGTTTITNVGLSNAGDAALAGNAATAFSLGMISHIDLAVNVDVVEGTVVTVTYTMETG